MGEMTNSQPEEEFDHDFSKTWWKDLFDKYGVDVILNGHTHTYMRAVPILLVGTGPGCKDITFDNKGFPSEPVKKVIYGNKKGQGRLQIVTGGYGVRLKREDELYYKNQWYVDNYKREFHYCEFRINGKELNLEVKRTEDGQVIDQVTIKHDSKKPSRWPKALIGPPCHGAVFSPGLDPFVKPASHNHHDILDF
jgi:hypothetical protein